MTLISRVPLYIMGNKIILKKKSVAGNLIFLVTFFCLVISQAQAKSFKLKFISDLNIKTGKTHKKIQIGGLSAIRLNKDKSILYAVSDDRSFHHPARIHSFKLSLDNKRFSLKPLNTIFLKNKNKRNFTLGTADFEGLDILEDGTFLVSSEGEKRFIPSIAPSITHFSKNGHYIKELKLPKKFKEETLYNAALESLSLSPNKKKLFIITESPLVNDITLSGILPLRLLSYRRNSKDHFSPEFEYLYPLEKGSLNKKKFNGISDILAISQNEFFVLERSYIKKRNLNTLKIFYIKIEKKTSDISNLKSLKVIPKNIIPLKKKLVFDLSDYSKHFEFGYQYLDNIEGICFGPRLKNGNQSLIFVSDNNFSKKQRTQFIFFELEIH